MITTEQLTEHSVIVEHSDTIEHSVTVAGKEIFFAEAGVGPAVVMLHGGGPGASGVSNYSRNIDALARHFRVIVPDMPGYGRSAKGIDQDDPVRLPRRPDPRAARRARRRHRPPDRQLLRRRGRTAAGARHPASGRPPGADGPRWDRDDAGRADRRAEEPSLVLRRRRSQPRQDGALHPHLSGVRRRLGARRADRPALPASIDPQVVANPPLRRPSGPTALRTLWRMDLTRDKRLKDLRTPTLVLWGRDDRVNRPAGGPMLLNAMANAELVMTSHTGHWLQWERAELFNRLVSDFLRPDSLLVRT